MVIACLRPGCAMDRLTVGMGQMSTAAQVSSNIIYPNMCLKLGIMIGHNTSKSYVINIQPDSRCISICQCAY